MLQCMADFQFVILGGNGLYHYMLVCNVLNSKLAKMLHNIKLKY